ncbi:MAG: hypothetical protein V1789_12340 [PVC group bacterium]
MHNHGEPVICSRRGEPTPAENLNWIYYGERLSRPAGSLSSLSPGWRGRIGVVLTIRAVMIFLIWLL